MRLIMSQHGMQGSNSISNLIFWSLNSLTNLYEVCEDNVFSYCLRFMIWEDVSLSSYDDDLSSKHFKKINIFSGKRCGISTVPDYLSWLSRVWVLKEQIMQTRFINVKLCQQTYGIFMNGALRSQLPYQLFFIICPTLRSKIGLLSISIMCL